MPPLLGACGAVLSHTGAVTCFAVLPSGTLGVGSEDGLVRTWVSGRCTATMKGHTRPVTALAALPPADR